MKPKHNYLYSIFLLLLIVVLSSGISLSRYVSTLSNTGDSSTIITVKEYDLDVTWTAGPNTIQYPGIPNQNYDFTLHNTKNTDLYYAINIGLSWNEDTPVVGLNVPLKMELYIVDEGNNLTLVEDSTTNTLYTSPEFIIDGGQDIKFCLKWNWGTSESDRNYKFANKKIDVKINVDATQ